MLDGGVEMKIPMEVFPKEIEKKYSFSKMNIVILGIDVLQRGCMVQTFSTASNSSIYIRHLERLRRRSRTKRRNKCPLFWVRREGDGNPRQVKLDTGASKFELYIS